jgi:hypothetical protein
MFLHEGYCVSGSAIVQAEDGSEARIGPATATSSSRGMMPGWWVMNRG